VTPWLCGSFRQQRAVVTPQRVASGYINSEKRCSGQKFDCDCRCAEPAVRGALTGLALAGRSVRFAGGDWRDGARSDTGAGGGTTNARRSNENGDARGQKMLASNENLRVATEIRLAPQKIFAASSGKDDASVQKID
jgi:hypothetical protein